MDNSRRSRSPQASSSNPTAGTTSGMPTAASSREQNQTDHLGNQSTNSEQNQSYSRLSDNPSEPLWPASANVVKKRPRIYQRCDEIDRLYSCSYPNCSKAYGTLNHLNAHVTMQKHGEKRNANEFKELQRQRHNNSIDLPSRGDSVGGTSTAVPKGLTEEENTANVAIQSPDCSISVPSDDFMAQENSQKMVLEGADHREPKRSRTTESHSMKMKVLHFRCSQSTHSSTGTRSAMAKGLVDAVFGWVLIARMKMVRFHFHGKKSNTLPILICPIEFRHDQDEWMRSSHSNYEENGVPRALHDKDPYCESPRTSISPPSDDSAVQGNSQALIQDEKIATSYKELKRPGITGRIESKSCRMCHSNRRKCNRKRPCERCVQMGLGNLCFYEDAPVLRNDREATRASRSNYEDFGTPSPQSEQTSVSLHKWLAKNLVSKPIKSGQGQRKRNIGIGDSFRRTQVASAVPDPNLNIYDGEDLTGWIVKTEMFPFECGAVADIYRGEIRGSRRNRLYREANKWTILNHENVLAFIGICRDIGPSPALISSICTGGLVMKYLQRNTKTPEDKLQICLGITKGLSYLHAHQVIHGNFSTSKVLIDDCGVPVIAGYGVWNVLDQSAQTTNLLSAPVRFTAPEYFTADGGPSSSRNKTGDVYSLSMVLLEIFSGFIPYHDLASDHAVLFQVVRSGRPNLDAFDNVVLPHSLRSLMSQMWNQLSSFRPDIEAVLERLLTLESNRLEEPSFAEQIMEVEGLAETSNDDRDKKDSSSSGEEASFTDLPEMNTLDLTGRRLKREAAIWSRLSHPNLLPFIGICDDIAPWPVLVSPFYRYGHIHKYLQKNPTAARMPIIHAIASGMEYLHSKDIVHGDLKAQNILVDKRGNPSICDFGVSKILGARGFTTMSVGTAPYMAPELFFVVDAVTQDRSLPTTTKSSDVYSFGLLVLEILTGGSPKRRPGRPIINSKEYSGLCPQRSDYPGVKNDLWDNCLMPCWSFDPGKRPWMKNIITGNHFSLEQPINSTGPGAVRRVMKRKRGSRESHT
ncbi:kinase-like domain-containing protein [Mycena floridula]|nr:kinase-like domain-containing protein [Mycena floridula]